MSCPPDLLLPTRPGLPDSHAPLRAAYPATGWATHMNYGQLTAFWLQVHASLRAEAGAVVALIDAWRPDDDGRAFAARFVPGLNQFLGHLDAHHRIEDEQYFPKFRAADPRALAGFEVLESDHALIHAQIVATVTGARTLLGALPAGGDPLRRARDAHALQLGRLRQLLDRHLSDEEEIVIPALLEHGERSVA